MSDWKTITLPKDTQGNQVSVNYYTDYVLVSNDGVKLPYLKGTIVYNFAKGKYPKGIESVRVCLSIRKQNKASIDAWESINFYLPDFTEKMRWTSRYLYQNSSSKV